MSEEPARSKTTAVKKGSRVENSRRSPMDSPEEEASPSSERAGVETNASGERTLVKFIEEFEKDPHSFSFYFGARLFECLRPDLPQIGHSERPSEDPVRFSQSPFLDFAPSTIRSLETFRDEFGDAPPRYKLGVNFMGLTGPNGPLPLTFTEYVYCRKHGYSHPDSPSYLATTSAAQRSARPDPTLADFLDLFNHRTISLFYRAWASSRKTSDFDRPSTERFSRFFRSFIGLGTPGLENRTESRDSDTGELRGVTDSAKIFFSGHFACQTRHAEGLASILADFFGVEIEIVEFVGHWIPLPEENQCRLGESPATGTLGETLIMGTRYWDCQLRCRLRMGPMPIEEYRKMLPGRDSFESLKSWVRHYIGNELFVDLQPVLRKEDVPNISLGSSGRLGYTTWLRSKPHKLVGKAKKVRWTKTPEFHKDADDLITLVQ